MEMINEVILKSVLLSPFIQNNQHTLLILFPFVLIMGASASVILCSGAKKKTGVESTILFESTQSTSQPGDVSINATYAVNSYHGKWIIVNIQICSHFFLISRSFTRF